MSSKVVSDSDFESRLALHAKQGKLKLTFFIFFLEKCEFLQMTPNIGKLYIIGKHFSLRVQIWAHYFLIHQ